MNDKQKLIDHLKNDVYCRLGVSKIHGIGVIAIKDIPNGTRPFNNLSEEKDKIIHLTNSDLTDVDYEVKKILTDFYGIGNNNDYDAYAYGPNYMNISFYLNHSLIPNITAIVDPKFNYYIYVTSSDIKKGEELLLDYNIFNNN